MTAGYSGTPLEKKLGIKGGQALALLGALPGFRATLSLPADVRLVDVLTRGTPDLDLVVLFVLLRKDLQAQFPRVVQRLKPAASFWIAWPKLAARKKTGMISDMTEDVVREIALPHGFVDVKVCAIDEVWSGLKCVLRVERRK